jgi:AAA domain, putative AbiEii toxin, Type IV TA system/AAA ATPase domain
MRLASVRIQNFKSLADTGDVRLDRINVLVGRNNHGKSAFIQAVHLIQRGSRMSDRDIRLGASATEITYRLGDINPAVASLGRGSNRGESAVFYLTWSGTRGVSLNGINFKTTNAGNIGGQFILESEPDNFIYTYLSKRKVTGFDQVVNVEKTRAVSNDLRYLVSKVDRLANADHPKAEEYRELCMTVLGFRVSSLASQGGHQAGILVGSDDYIPIEDMGEGVSSLLGLITDLCVADGKLFLIEEPENDIHPDGLKKLLGFIIEKAANNQFIVATHSNIVTRYLGSAEGSKIFEFKSEYVPNAIPTSEVREVENTPEARIAVLRQLGYELSDFELWEGWLILEESSAEFIIRNLIPWFVPRLARIRTVAAGGTGNVEPTFEDYRRLFLFAHLEPQYRNRAWVIVDGDTSGMQVVADLRSKYRDWPADHFRAWTQVDFELYFPAQFTAKAREVLALPHDQKWEAKKALHKEVSDWCREHPEEAKAALAQSAAEVVGLLQEIDRALFGPAERT